jgi:hypothetical protein
VLVAHALSVPRPDSSGRMLQFTEMCRHECRHGSLRGCATNTKLYQVGH